MADNYKTRKLRGFGNEGFGAALDAAKKEFDEPTQHAPQTVSADYKDPREYDDSVPRTSDSADPGDKQGHEVKLEIKAWPRVPVTPEEWDIYHGLHMHTPDNKFGLHTHMPGGTLTGGHTHGPQNLLGAHHHKEEVDQGVLIDGQHTHQSTTNMPDGYHGHTPENFG
jgi:hypothetical protein